MARQKPALKQQKQKKFPRILALAAIVFLSPVIIFLLFQPEENNSQKTPETTVSTYQEENIQAKRETPIPFARANVSDKEASVFYQEQILPILKESLNDPIPQIKDITQSLANMIKSKKVEVGIASTYRGDSLAGTYGSPDGNMLWITLSAPRLMDYRNSMDLLSFKNLVVIAICHETLHILYDPIFTQGLYKSKNPSEKLDQIRLEGEATIWGLTIEKVIGPMIKAKKVLQPTEIEAAKAYNESGNNYKSPLWTEWVRQNRFTSSM